MGIVWQLPPRDDPPRDEDRFVHRNGGVCLNPHDLSISTKHNASWLNPIDFYEEFPFSAIPSRKYKSMYIYILYIYIHVQPPPKKLKSLVDFLDCSKIYMSKSPWIPRRRMDVLGPWVSFSLRIDC